MNKQYTFLNAVFYHYANLAKTARLALYGIGIVAAVAGTVALVKVAVAL